MDNRAELTKKLIAIDSSLKEPDILLPFSFNLYGNDSKVRVDGISVLTENEVILYINKEKIHRIPLRNVKEFAFRQGIGCVFIEYTDQEDKDHLLCRGDMQYFSLFAAVVKELNRKINDGNVNYEYEKEINRVCPKCGRPYRDGSSICTHCVNKKNYILRLWEIAKPYRIWIFASVLCYFIIALANLLPPYLNRILVDDYIKAETMPQLWQFITVIVSMLGVNILIRLLSMGRSLLLINTSNKVIVKLREMIFSKIQMLSIAKISKRTSGELMNRVSGDTNELSRFITHEFGDMFEQIITLLAVGILLFSYDWKLALMIILPTPIVMYINRLFWSKMHKMYHRQWNINAKASAILHDIFSGIRVVKSFGMEHRETEKYDEVTSKERDVQIRNEKFFGKINPILSFFMGIGEFFLLYYVGSQILNGQMTLGEMSQFSAYVSIIYGPLRWLSSFPRRLVRTMTSIAKIFEIIDEEVDVADKTDAIDHDIQGYITFENVSFGYDNTSNVLKNISFEIKPGEMVGIVGKSGVGKSTLINLVMRLYDVTEGTIKIDGIDIKDISQESLRSQIGVVLQETFLFSGTIYDNIAYAKPDATRDEVIRAAKVAGAHSFIMKLPNAYNTKVGERGHTLSGGERQRVAIARALLHNPRILILDEATSALDTETEKQIQDALQKLIADRTTLAIAHRLSTLRNATKIFVLDKGQLAEIGSHEELMRQKGIYYGLVMAQRQMSKMSPKNNATKTA